MLEKMVKVAININKFMKRYSGRIIGVGDIFDFYRSSINNESQYDYLDRTAQWWKHIDVFIEGNHDAFLLRKYKDIFNPIRIYKKGPVLALHGHQLKFTNKQAKMIEYERKWNTDRSKHSLYWDIEEWICAQFCKRFNIKGKRAYSQALSTITEIDKQNLLDDKVSIIITGHTHLPFKTKVKYKNKEYKVVNCGSTLYGTKFNPIYVREIDRWFISDLHLGTKKSKLN
jgi:UDP-2,3-diacylglucosamine pyrophosphatase LpxH